MNALVKCTKYEDWTKKYFPCYHPYSIPFLSKPLIEFYIDYLLLCGAESIKFVVEKYDETLFNEIEKDSRWGVKVSIELEQTFDTSTEGAYDIVMDEYCLICYDKNHEGSYLGEIKTMFAKSVSDSAVKTKARLPECAALKIASIKDYFDTNMALLERFSQCFSMKGYGAEKDVFMGMNVVINGHSAPTAPIVIDNNTQIESDCEIGPGAIIGNLSFIDENTRFRRSILADRTYVGKNQDIFEKIIVRQNIINPADGSIRELTDSYDFSKTYTYSALAKIKRFFEIIFAAALLLVLLPWRAFFIFSAPPKRYLSFTDSSGKKQKLFYYERSGGTMKSWFFKLMQDKIPRLFAVISGKMSLVGDSLQSAKNGENLKFYGGTFKPGAFTYADSIGKKDHDWKVMDDLYCKNHKSVKFSAAIILRTFITRLFGDQS